MAGVNSILDTLDEVARQAGLPPEVFRSIAKIESSYDPNARTGSYHGLFQISKEDFKKYGSGSITNPRDNAKAAAKKMLAQGKQFKKATGRDPTPSDLYMIHQQGRAGATAHAKNPEGIAWKNIRPYYTEAEAKRRGFPSADAYAQAAIWGNLPKEARERFGSVDQVTSSEFTGWWQGRVGQEVNRQGDASEPRMKDIFPEDVGAPSPEPQLSSSSVTQSGVETPPMPGKAKRSGFTPELLDRTFGEPFGQLFQNEATPGKSGLGAIGEGVDSIKSGVNDFVNSVRTGVGLKPKRSDGSVPPAIPLFKDFFSKFSN